MPSVFNPESTGDPGAMLQMLHHIQQTHQHISEEALSTVADAFNVSRAEVYGVVTFYEDFTLAPRGRCVDICNAEACQALGSAALLAGARQVDADKRIREVFCLGNCAVGPNIRIGHELYARVDSAKLAVLLDGLNS